VVIVGEFIAERAGPQQPYERKNAVLHNAQKVYQEQRILCTAVVEEPISNPGCPPLEVYAVSLLTFF
jgi:hypothetical protein